MTFENIPISSSNSCSSDSWVPASVGELVQGYQNDKAFLVNAPIDRYSRAHFSQVRDNGKGLTVIHDAEFARSAKGAQMKLQKQDKQGIYTLSFQSPVPRGKGMASSTSEVAGALAVSDYGQLNLKELHQEVMNIDKGSDATYLPGITHINHLEGTVLGSYPAPFSMRAVIIDQDGEIETNNFDRERALMNSKKYQGHVDRSLKLLQEGLASGCLKKTGQACTISSVVNNRILPKIHLKKLMALIDGHSVVGVNSAHTGTVLGLLFDSRKISDKVVLEATERLCGRENILGVHYIISGSCVRSPLT